MTQPVEVIEITNEQDTGSVSSTGFEITDIPDFTSGSIDIEITDIQTKTAIEEVLGPNDEIGVTMAQIKSKNVFNFSDTTKVHVGPKIIDVTVTQNVVKKESVPDFIWKITKNSTRLEKITCAFVAFSVIFSILVAVYYTLVLSKKIPDGPGSEGGCVCMPRERMKLPFNDSVPLELTRNPIKLVITQHLVTRSCDELPQCPIDFQATSMDDDNLHLAFNFLVEVDGHVNEGCGWGIKSSSYRWLYPCAINIAYIAPYNDFQITPQQVDWTKALLKEGLREGYLDPHFLLIAANSFTEKDNPETHLSDGRQDFDHDSLNNNISEMDCNQIHESKDESSDDEEPQEWYISRDQWEEESSYNFTSIEEYGPVRLVIVNDFRSNVCYNFTTCTSQIKILQGINLISSRYIGYNFILGNDGRVYEIRGWGSEAGEEISQFQPCALYISFFGNYTDYKSTTEARVSPAQINRTLMLLEEGVRRQFLHPDYLLFSASDVLDLNSPGEYLYKEIQTWEHYARKNIDIYKEITCDSLRSGFI